MRLRRPLGRAVLHGCGKSGTDPGSLAWGLSPIFLGRPWRGVCGLRAAAGALHADTGAWQACLVLRTLFLVATCLAALPVQAQMYKCVDERGVTHYTDKPPAGCKSAREVDIKPIPPVGGSVKPRAEDLKREDHDFQRRRADQDRAEAKEKAELVKRCQQVRSDIARLSTQRRVVEVNRQGERVFVEDAERERQLERLRSEARGCP